MLSRRRSATPPASSATAEAYARLAEALPGLSVPELAHAEPFPVGAGRVRAAQPAEGGPALETFLSRDVEQVVRDHGHRTRPEVIASFGLHRHFWPACLLITAPWFLHRRVPRSPVTHVSHDRTGGGMRMAVRPQASFACLPDDPAALFAGARVVRDEEALRTEVRAAIAEIPAAGRPQGTRSGRTPDSHSARTSRAFSASSTRSSGVAPYNPSSRDATADARRGNPRAARAGCPLIRVRSFRSPPSAHRGRGVAVCPETGAAQEASGVR